MHQSISSYQSFNQCANGYSHNQQANSYENTNIGIILKDIMKYLTITPMYFHETKGQVGQIKSKSKC
jgi:hypothetical protein